MALAESQALAAVGPPELPSVQAAFAGTVALYVPALLLVSLPPGVQLIGRIAGVLAAVPFAAYAWLYFTGGKVDQTGPVASAGYGLLTIASIVWIWMLYMTSPLARRFEEKRPDDRADDRVVQVSAAWNGPIDAKRARAEAILSSLGSVAVAYSGGADSALVSALAHRALGHRAVAVIDASPSLPEDELRDARRVAATIGIELVEIATDELSDERYARNPADRCYYCKDALFTALEGFLRTRGYDAIVDGYNADDAAEVLHGRRAAAERAVRSPLYEAGLSKGEVRELSRALGLPTADKPAAACLASRFPTGLRVTREGLRQVELAERLIHGLGVRELRVRHHGDTARIETALEEIPLVIAHRETISRELRALGFRYVVLDLEGYRRGGTATAPIHLDGITLA